MSAAFGMGDAAAPEPFLIALGALGVLTDAAAKKPLLVVIEDAHWLDRPTAGASRGIGRATAVALGRQGTDVILPYLSNAQEAESAVAEIQGTGARAAALRLDLGDMSSFDSFASSFKAVLRDECYRENFDCLINNGGAMRPGSFADATEADFAALVNVLFKGTFFL